MLPLSYWFRSPLFLLGFFLLTVVCLSLYWGTLASGFSIHNFRLITGGPFVQILLDAWYGTPLTERIETPDDPGYLLLYSIAAFVSGVKTISPFVDGAHFPLILKVVYIIVHAIAAYFVIFTSGNLLGNLAKKILLCFLLMPNSFAVFLGFDVYLFPIYAFCAVTYLLGEIIDARVDVLKVIVVVVLVGFCELQRKWSIFPLYLLAILALTISDLSWSKRLKVVALCALVPLMMTFSLKLLFKAHGHTVWHPIHAGFFEFGGCIDKSGQIYPFFVFNSDEVTKRNDVICRLQWADQIQYEIGKIHGQTDIASTGYEQLLRDQVVAFARTHPGAISRLVFVRLINAMSFLPFKEYRRTGHITNFGVTHHFEWLVFLAFFLFFLWSDERWRLKVYLTLTLAMALAPTLLVHSQHIIYNLPVNFIQVAILAIVIEKVWVKFRLKIFSQMSASAVLGERTTVKNSGN